MNRLTIERSLDSPVSRVWEIVGKPGAAPGPGISVPVKRPGAPDGTGMLRGVKVGPATVYEEITSVGRPCHHVPDDEGCSRA